jgi:peroxiredoxin-like protein
MKYAVTLISGMQTKDERELFFAANVIWTEGRSGELESRGLPTLSVSAPPEFQGRENTWTPEHLYAGSVAACFMATFVAIAERSKLEFKSLRVETDGKLQRIEGAGYEMTEIILRPTLVIRHSRDIERATRILEKAGKQCFIANSIKSKVRLEPRVYHEKNPSYPCPAVAAPDGAQKPDASSV